MEWNGNFLRAHTPLPLNLNGEGKGENFYERNCSPSKYSIIPFATAYIRRDKKKSTKKKKIKVRLRV